MNDLQELFRNKLESYLAGFADQMRETGVSVRNLIPGDSMEFSVDLVDPDGRSMGRLHVTANYFQKPFRRGVDSVVPDFVVPVV